MVGAFVSDRSFVYGRAFVYGRTVWSGRVRKKNMRPYVIFWRMQAIPYVEIDKDFSFFFINWGGAK